MFARIFLCTAVLVAGIVSLAGAATIQVSQPVQVTDNSYYERGQSLVYDGSDYWLFYGRSATVTDPYGSGDPDISDYQITYKKAAAIADLASASAVQGPGAADIYLGETGAAAFGGEVWVFGSVVGATTDLCGWYTTDGSSWTAVANIATGLSSGSAHHDEVAYNGEIFVLVRRGGDFYTTHSSTPKVLASWSTEAGVGSAGGLAHFFVEGTDLYMAVLKSPAPRQNEIYQYNSGSDSWSLVASAASDGWDPTLLKVGSRYLFAQAPYVSGRQYIIGWDSDALDSGFFNDGSTLISEAQYGGNVWVDMWPIGFTDDDGDSYLFMTSERNPSNPSAEIAANIWFFEVSDTRGGFTVGTDNYTYLPNAMAAASAGDEIKIADGTYVQTGQLNITQSLTLTGESEAGVILDMSAVTGYGFSVAADDVTLQSFTISPPDQNYPIHASGTSNPPDGFDNLTIQNVTIAGTHRRSGFDIHGYNHVVLSYLTSRDAYGGNGLQVTGCVDVDIDNITTSDNAWGSIAIYCSQYLNRGSDDVYIDCGSLAMGEDFLFSQDEFGLVSTDIVVDGYEYIVRNETHRPDGAGFYFYKDTAADAIAFALAFTGYEEDSYIYEIATGDYLVGDGMSIKAAIAAASSGDEIQVAGGTYVEEGQIVVDKDLVIIGDADDKPIVQTDRNTGTSGDARGWWLQPAGYDLELHNLVLDGTTYLIYQGVRTFGTGVLNNCDLRNIKYNESGPNYNGVGVACFDNWTITDNTFEEMGRIGVIVFGSGVTAAEISGNTYTGKGTGDWLDYGVELGGGAVGTLTNNIISSCQGVASSDGSESAGILATDYFGPGTAGTLTGNILEGNTMGVAIGYLDTDETAITARYNDFSETDEYGLINSGATTTDAILNWWGDAAGPTVVVPPGPGDGPAPCSPSSFDGVTAPARFTRPSGNGDQGRAAANVSDQVDYDPWIGKTGGENLVADPDPLIINTDDYTGSAYVDGLVATYLGGGSAGLYGYSIDVEWDVTKATATTSDFTRPATGAFATAVLFQVTDQSSGSGGHVRVDAALGGAHPGVVGEADLFAATFTGAGCGDSDVTLTINHVRDNQNQAISGIYDDDGLLQVDMNDPSVTNEALVRTNLPDTGYAKDGDDLVITADFDDGCAGTGGLTITADLSGLLEGGGTAVAPTSLVGTLATWSLSAVDLTTPDESKSVTLAAVDPLGNSVSTSVSVYADNTLPAATVTGLTAFPGHNKVDLSWTNPTGGDPNLDAYGVMLRRVPWGDYPTYTPPAPDYPDSTEGERAYWAAGMATAYTDTGFDGNGQERDIYYYSAFVFDAAYNYSISNSGAQDGATNYWLGDVAPYPNPLGDGYVTTSDISALSDTYGHTPTSPNWNPHCDIGPTSNSGGYGIPMPDGIIGFEDLMIFAINFGVVGPTDQLPAIFEVMNPSVGNVALTLEIVPGDEILLRVLLKDDDALAQGARFLIDYDHSVCEFLSAGPGEVTSGCEQLFFRTLPGEEPEINLASLGAESALGGTGELVVLRFRRIGEGDLHFALVEPVLRDSQNRNLLDSFADVTIDELAGDLEVPKNVFLNSAYPNPVAQQTAISFGLPKNAPVRVAIFDVSGRLVRTLAEGLYTAGVHNVTWDRTTDNGARAGANVYFYRLETQERTITHRLVVTN